MIQEVVDNIYTILVGVAGVAAWFGERTKRKADQVKLSKDIIGMYRDALTDFEARYKVDMENNEKDIELIKNEVKHWQEKYLGLELKYKNLRKEFEKCKKQAGWK